MKKQLLASLGGATVGFIYGWMVWGVLLMSYMQANMTQYPGLMKEESPLMILGYFLGNFISAFLLTYIFRKWANISTAKSGFINGALIGFMVTLGIDLGFMMGMNLYTTQSLIVDIIAGTIMYGAIGAVSAIILGKLKD